MVDFAEMVDEEIFYTKTEDLHLLIVVLFFLASENNAIL